MGEGRLKRVHERYQMRGFVEVIAEYEVRGWAFEDTDPDCHLEVVARLRDEVVGQTSADIMRLDLFSAGFGIGDHEFHLTFDRPLSPADLMQLDVRAERGSDSVRLALLPGSNQSRADAASDAAVPIVDPDQYPVFILGPARSGTSAVALGLLKCRRYEGSGEGHLMPLAQELLKLISDYYDKRLELTQNDTTLRSIDRVAFQRMVFRSFIQLTKTAFPSGYWIDKTPTAEMVRAAPLMRQLWPNARFIFLRRRVIENIISRRRKFPQDTLENHYLDWVDVLSAWLDVKASLGSFALELDQLEMARDPKGFAGKIVRFLEMPPPEASRFTEFLSTEHPEQTSALVGTVAPIDTLGLAPDVLRELKKACDPIMRLYGYGYGPEYHSSDV